MFSVVIKDYLDSLHNLALATDYVTFFGIIKATVIYVVQCFGLAIYYVLSFHWLRDFMELPVTFKHTYSAILQGKGLIRWDPLLSLSLKNGAFSFLDTSPANRHSLFSGFFNSFFLSLPLSVANILTFRALLVNGTIAGLASFFGSFCGQFIFYFCMLFGLEFVIQPLFQFDLLVIVAGGFLAIEVLYHLANFPNFTVLSVIDRKPLLNFFKISFILTGLEQACVCNYFGNINVTPVYSMLETTNSPHFFLLTIFYFVGLMLGYAVWSFTFYFVIVQVRSLVSEKLNNVSFFEINQKIHYSCVIGLLVMTMSSFFYYGYDFFAYKAFGYVAEDEAMAWMAPDNKHYIEMTSLIEEEDAEMEEDEEDTLIDGKPFQTGDERAEVSFELFGIEAENDELNKELTLERLEDKEMFRPQATQSKAMLPYIENPKYYKDEEPKYNSPRITDDDPSCSSVERFHETYVNSAFRQDEYVLLRDRKTGTYIPETQLYRQFRDRYNTNILYRKLMKLNNVSFLSGQPKTSNLSAKDEFDLYHRRVILQGYLNSIHRYNHIINSRGISYPENVYNQQFKGSLNFVRKFNAVELTEYAQPDVVEKIDDPYPSYSFYDDELFNEKFGAKNKVLKYDQPLYKKFKDEQLALLHEELRFRQTYLKPRRFLRRTDSRPLYIGWDNVGPGFKSDLLETAEKKPDNLQRKKKKKTVKQTEQTEKQTKKGVKKVKVRKGIKIPFWKRIFTNLKIKQVPIRGRIDRSICAKYEPIKKRPVKNKRNLPDYYHFQSWVPGTETVDSTTRFKLPSLKATKSDLEKISEVFELVPEEDITMDDGYQAYMIAKRKSAMRKTQFDYRYDSFMRRLPIYDWYWTILDIETDDFDKIPAFKIGDLTPPKMDGIAWPGQNERYGLTCPGFERKSSDR